MKSDGSARLWKQKSPLILKTRTFTLALMKFEYGTITKEGGDIRK